LRVLAAVGVHEDLLDVGAVFFPTRQALRCIGFHRVVGGVYHDAVVFAEQHPVADRRSFALLLRPRGLHFVFVDDRTQVGALVVDAMENPADELFECVIHRSLEPIAQRSWETGPRFEVELRTA